MIESTQSKLYAHWFAGSNLAFVYGVDIAWSRITTIISRSSAVPMSLLHGWWGWALWIPTIICGCNLGLCIGYWAFERSLPRKYRPALGKDARVKEGWSKRYFGLKSVYQLYVSLLISAWQLHLNHQAIAFLGGVRNSSVR